MHEIGLNSFQLTAKSESLNLQDVTEGRGE